MTRIPRILLTAVMALISILTPAMLDAQKVELSVQGRSRSGEIEVGSLFYVYITVKNLEAAPSVLKSVGGGEVKYFDRQSTRSQMSSVNGHVTQSTESVYVATCLATHKGSYSVGPVTVGGVKSNVAKYNIVDAGTASSGQYGASPNAASPDPAQSGQDPSQQGPTYIGKGNDKLFMRASVSKTTAYEQEALVYTVKLYTTYGSIKFIGATDAPKFDGFVIEESNAVSNQLTFETYQGRQYATAVIARYIIFPQMAGKLKIVGNKYTVSTDANEYYHDPIFSTLTVRRPIQLNVTPNDLEITVNPLPSPRPANFSGGVGKFNITSSLPSDKLTANQAASVKYIVSGEGNLKYIHLPDLNALFPDQLEVFSPTTDVKTNVGASNVGGTVSFDYSFMPLEQGSYTIPEVELVYFNPASGKYETARTRSYKVEVARGEESSKSQAMLTFDSNLMNVSLNGSPAGRPYVRGFLYWLWFIIPGCILLGVAIGRRKYIASRADVVGLRSRRAGKMARKRLKKAAQAMKSSNEDLFYDEILKAVWGYLSDKLRLPTSELNRDNVSQILTERGIPSEDITRLVKLLDDSEFAKYSPASLRRPMQEMYDGATELLNMLESSFSKPSPAAASESSDQKSDDGNGGSSAGGGVGKALSLLLLLATMLMPGVVGAAESGSIDYVAEVQCADSAYSAGRYEEAAEIYQSVVDRYGFTAPLLYNLGCSYYKSGNEGGARLAFERALRIDPSNSRIRRNLNYVSGRIEDANKAELKGRKGSVSPDPQGFFRRAVNHISGDTSSDVWAEFAAMAFILTLLAVAVYLFVENVRIRKFGFFSAIILLVFTVVFVIFAEMAASHYMSRDEAVVTAFKVTLTSDPHESDTTVGSPLVRGTKLEIEDTELNADGRIGWYKVKLNSSLSGWVEASQIEII